MLFGKIFGRGSRVEAEKIQAAFRKHGTAVGSTDVEIYILPVMLFKVAGDGAGTGWTTLCNGVIDAAEKAGANTVGLVADCLHLVFGGPFVTKDPSASVGSFFDIIGREFSQARISLMFRESRWVRLGVDSRRIHTVVSDGLDKEIAELMKEPVGTLRVDSRCRAFLPSDFEERTGLCIIDVDEK